jgi:hypothetical protein
LLLRQPNLLGHRRYDSEQGRVNHLGLSFYAAPERPGVRTELRQVRQSGRLKS